MGKDNVVPIARGRSEEAQDEARKELQPEVLFRRTQLGPEQFNNLSKGAIISTSPVVNRSLALANEAQFLEMCLPILWGDEKKIHFQRFGLLLRGAIETFKPLTLFELSLVKNVVACQWRLDRLLTMQGNIYDNEARSGDLGKYGLPAATHIAREQDGEIYAAQDALATAVAIYNQMLRASINANRERGI